MPTSLPARRVRHCRSANVIGPAVVRLRQLNGWTQDELVAHLQLRNCCVTRAVVANIESGRSCATDFLVHILAQVFQVQESDLFPPPRPGQVPRTLGLTPETALRRRRILTPQSRSVDGAPVDTTATLAGLSDPVT